MSTQPTIPDARSYNQRLLAQVRAILMDKALDDVAMYKIGSRELTKIPLPELRAWEADLEARCVRERRRKAGKGARNSYIIFGSAAPRGPRLAGLRLWFGRLIFALFHEPEERKPEPLLRPADQPAISQKLEMRCVHTDRLCESGKRYPADQVYFAAPQQETTESIVDETSFIVAESLVEMLESSGSVDADTTTFADDTSSYSAPDTSSCDSFSGGDGGDSGGAGAGGEW